MSRRRRRETIRHKLSLFPSFQTQKDFSQERQQMGPRCLPVVWFAWSHLSALPFGKFWAEDFVKSLKHWTSVNYCDPIGLFSAQPGT
jgi:hypothetical protein